METLSALLALCEGNQSSPVDSLFEARDAELRCFPLYAHELMVEQTVDMPVIPDAMTLTVMFL